MSLENINDKETNVEHYGQIEVPNIKISGMQFLFKPEPHFEKIYTYECNTVEGYYEEYDKNKGWIITFSTQMFSPDIYDILIHHENFWVEIEEIVRDQMSGQDSIKTRLLRNFNHINIKHKLYCDGEPTIWYITLTHKKRPYYRHLEREKEEKGPQIIKKKKELRKVCSDTLSEVKL